jgi:hypothetical protein
MLRVRVFNNEEFASIKKSSIYLNKSKYASILILICSLFNFHIKTTELTYELESYPWSHELKNNKNTFYSTFWLHQYKFIRSNNASIVTTSTNTLTPYHVLCLSISTSNYLKGRNLTCAFVMLVSSITSLCHAYNFLIPRPTQRKSLQRCGICKNEPCQTHCMLRARLSSEDIHYLESIKATATEF